MARRSNYGAEKRQKELKKKKKREEKLLRKQRKKADGLEDGEAVEEGTDSEMAEEGEAVIEDDPVRPDGHTPDSP